MDLSFDTKTFSGWAPLFPLPNVVLLPGALLPLHIFEPRYRLMVRDALAGEKLVAMALLRPGFEQNEDGAPEIHEWVGLGRIVAHSPLPDGRSNMVLVGLRRARVIEEDRSRPYRLARLEVHGEDGGETAEPALADLRDRLARALARLPEQLVRDPVRLGVARKIGVPLGPLLDLVADAVDLDADARQALLAEPLVAARARKLVEVLDARTQEVRPRSVNWPFSKN